MHRSTIHAIIAAITVFAACGRGPGETLSDARPVRIDGSSTVFPLTQAIVAEFVRDHPQPHVRATISGTAGGFRQFCAGRIDVSAAGRPIRRNELEECHRGAVSFVELPIAYDGIAIVVNPRATWISDITVQELKKVWEPDARGKIVRWNQIREEWPDRELHLFGADVESGTYDYFTAAISGVEGSSRSDFTASADDEVLVQAIARDELALAFLPLVYYEKNKHRLKPVAIDNEDGDDGVGPIAPSVEAIRNGTYQPLARPIFLYARAQALNRASVGQFIDFYLARAGALAARLGYMPLDPSAYALVAERRKARWTGTVFGEGGSQVGLTVAQLLEKARIP